MSNEVYASLLKVQQNLKAGKDKYNSFGKYSYRSAESIFEAAKPLCHENGLILTCSDDIILVGDRIYIKAIAKVTDIVTGNSFETSAMAREDDAKKGMDGAQLTGCCSSYARKYALCGLFAIDDNKDADTNEHHTEVQNRRPQEDSKAGNTDKYIEAILAKASALHLTQKDLDLVSAAVYKRPKFSNLSAKQIEHFAANFDKVLDTYAASQAQ